MSALPSFILRLDDTPLLVQKCLFELMTPADLLHLSITSDVRYERIKLMNIKASINIRFSKENVTILVKTVKNMVSEIVVGTLPGEQTGKKFNCFFDDEYFIDCMKTEHGVVYPYGLETVMNRLLNLFPQASIDDLLFVLNFDLRDEDYNPLFRVLENIRDRDREVQNLLFTSVNIQWAVDTMEPFHKVGELTRTKLEYSGQLIIQNGATFPFDTYLDIGFDEIVLANTSLTDEDFNRLILLWNASTNTEFRRLIIRTSELPEGVFCGEMLRGMARRESRFITDTTGVGSVLIAHDIQRLSDGMMATVIRKNNELVFSIDNR